MHPSPALATELSGILLDLYRLAHESPLQAFQSSALALLKPRLPFDSAMWGTATHTPTGIDIHTIHLENQPAEMLASYERVKHQDTAAERVGLQLRSTIGFNARDWFHRPDQAELRAHGRRFEQANFFITTDYHPPSGFVHWITLFRASERARCSTHEEQLLALLAPHVMQALTLNRVAHLDRLETPAAAGRGHAIADPRGVMCHADAVFETLLADEWTGWRGTRLPAPLLTHLQRGAVRHLGARTVVTSRHAHGLLFLAARPRCRADGLAPRELAVAHLLAHGATYKEIARTLERSPATVRNQIRSVYDKLEVTNVAGLIEALRLAA